MTATATAAEPEQQSRPRKVGGARPVRIVGGLLGAVVIAWFAANVFLALAYYPEWFFDNRLLMAVIGMLAGVGGAALLFFFVNVFIEGLPQRFSEGVIPYVFVFPSFFLLGLVLVYPTLQTINYSFANQDSTAYVGFDNYVAIFGSGEFWLSLTNNALWLIVVPALTVVVGLVVALFADRLSAQGEKVAKSFIFLPMAISFVAASTIWAIQIYSPNPDIGLLNSIVTSLGGEAQNWIRLDTLRLNSFLMMVILIWMQAGFAMILLSGGIKGVPEETLEAARMDGASEPQVFFQVIIPQIKGTMITVFITVTILVLKVFDIIYVLTNGQASTNVIAVQFFQELFTFQRAGRASAIVVVLLLLVTPILIYQVRHYRKEGAR
ncbi:sugar ABC transporter permease [Ruania suaedae]|uniref:carbohydrate ABC transporter permease n=1 Tax=Ruania suaedae TaxID=2897774 RepID=UPI001E38543F|nr:sugar ABC transporter permease [Ruania suaedae]UFU02933.1 sugar ABC transporter permease [Ruania suaedae]